MPLSKETIPALRALQKEDAVLDALKKEMNAVPAQVAALRAALDAGKGSLTELKAAIMTLEKRKKEKELDLAGKEEAARKHSLELNQVKTNEAFKALQKEIDGAKAEGGELETRILEIMEDLDATRKKEKAAQAEFKGIEAKANSEIAVLEARLKELEGKYSSAKGGRDALAEPIPADVMKIYNHVRSRGKLDAVVPIEKDVCSACRITLAPQVIVDAAKGKSLVTCESCQRIIYRPEGPVKPVPPAPAEVPAPAAPADAQAPSVTQ